MKEKYFWWSAFAGYMFHGGLSMFRQDVMGLEKYIDYLQLTWVDLSPWWGLGVMVLAVVILLSEIRTAKKEYGE